MTDLPIHRIASAFFNRPLLLAPEAGASIAGFLAGRMRAGGGRGGNERSAESIEVFGPTRTEAGGTEVHSPRAGSFHGSTPIGADGRPLPFRRTENGVAIISIIGELVGRGAWIGASSGLVSFEAIRFQLRSAAADPLTRAIVLDLETPGGEAVGAIEVAAVVREVAKIKPVVAVVDGMAASAGYAVASGATRIITIPTGQVGSIGVLWCHFDLSAAMDADGVVPTLLFAGAHKVDGNPFEPLPDDVRKSRQTSIDSFYEQFVECVAAGRGKRLTAAAARATEARVMTGAEAVRVGLADAVGTFDDVLSELSRPAGVRRLASPSSTTAISNGSHPKMTAIAAQQIITGATTTGLDDDPEANRLTETPILGALETVAPHFNMPADAAAAFREQAAELVSVAQRAQTTLGVAVDAGAAIRAGMTPEGLRHAVYNEAARRAAAASIVVNLAAVGQPSGGGIAAAARRQAAATSGKEAGR